MSDPVQQAKIVWEPAMETRGLESYWAIRSRWEVSVEVLANPEDDDSWETREVDADEIYVPDEVCRALREGGVLSTNEAKVLTLGQLFDLIMG